MPVLRRSRLVKSLVLLGWIWSVIFASFEVQADRGSFAQYEKALRSIRFKQWAEAASSLRRALEEKPNEIDGPVTRPYGMHFEPYLPHFYLGLALCKLGHPEEAMEHWRLSDEQGAFAKVQNAADLKEKRQECELAFLPQALEETRRARESTRGSLDALSELAPQDSDLGSAESVTLRDALLFRFETTSQTFESVANDPPLDEIWKMAEQYRRQRVEADALRQQVLRLQREQAKQDALDLQAALATFREEMEQTRIAAQELEEQLAASDAPLPEELRERIQQVVERVLQMDQALTETDLNQVTLDRLQSWRQQWTHLRSSIANLSQRVESSRLSVELWRAASELFAGEYNKALEQLAGSSFNRPRSRAQAALLRAAAHHGLYLRSARTDSNSLQRAREEIARCRSTDPLLEPDPGYFSPKFLELFAGSAER